MIPLIPTTSVESLGYRSGSEDESGGDKEQHVLPGAGMHKSLC